MVVEVNNQRTAYVLFDGNIEKGFRDEIIEATKDLVDEIEVITTIHMLLMQWIKDIILLN